MKKKILLVDDEGLVTKGLQSLLNKQGYDAVVAASGEEAIEQCKRSDFDLIVSDIRMPHLGGIETIKKIRQVLIDSNRYPIREIVMTGYADEGSYKSALELGVADYLYKPFDIDYFLSIIKKNL